MLISIVMNFASSVSNTKIVIDDYHRNNGIYQNDDDFYFGNPNGNSGHGNNPIDNFGENFFDQNYFDGITGQIKPVSNANSNHVNMNALLFVESPLFNSIMSCITTIITVLLYSLNIGIATLYLRLSRNQYEGFSYELNNSFVVSFHNGYWKKVGVVLVKNILVYLYTLLLIVPGIIQGYKLYFVEFIMAENPKLSISQVNEISKKMTADHKTELFKLDLSFIGWHILVILTFGIAGIYVIPYVSATKALYYQNFKVRCMQEHRLTAIDFMSDEERRQNFNNYNYYGQANGYNPNYNGANQGQPNYYNANNPYARNPYQQGNYNSNMGYNGAQPNYQNPNMNYYGNMPNQNYQYPNMNVNNQQFNQATNPNYAQNGYTNASNGVYGAQAPTTPPNAQNGYNEQNNAPKACAVDNDIVNDEKVATDSVDNITNSDIVGSEVVEEINENTNANQMNEESKNADELN